MQVIPGPRYVPTGFDGSPNSAVALRRAATEAGERHARLDVVRSGAPCHVIVCDEGAA
jgi:hypothetical protein